MPVPAALTYLPLNAYVEVERDVALAMEADLRDAQNELEKRLARLAQRSGGLSTEVRQAQLSQISQQLRLVQNSLWKELGQDIEEGGVQAADKAADVQAVYDKVLWSSAGASVPEELVRAQHAYAREVVRTYYSRTVNNIPLSSQVYKTQALSQGWVDRAVNRVILQGGSWRDIAKAVTPMIDPNTPGGVSYAAKRLGRTELNNAFHTTQTQLGEANPWVEGQKWNLSRQHPKADDCDVMAKASHYRGGDPGVYLATDVPRKPHPQCMCFITPETVSEEEFFDRLLRGDFSDPTAPYSSAARGRAA
jgi:hypothetical protein